MGKLRQVRIAGTGHYVPERVVTNKELEQQMDTSDEWIVQRSGIRERRWAAPDQGPAELALEAAKRAMDMAQVTANDIDMCLVATLSPDYYFPGTSYFIQDYLGMGTKPCMDVRAQCSGFLYGLNLAQLYVGSGQVNRILLIGSELHSRGMSITTKHRTESVLFGDGAGAVIVEPCDDPERGILTVELHAQGEHRDRLKVECPSFRDGTTYCTKEMIDEGRIYPYMDGKFVFKNAVQRMPEVTMSVLEQNNLTPSDIDQFIFHQANLRINEATLKTLGQPPEKFHNNIDRYGNCSAASIPMCLDECVRQNKLKENDLLCMASFGSGFSWAGALIRW